MNFYSNTEMPYSILTGSLNEFSFGSYVFIFGRIRKKLVDASSGIILNETNILESGRNKL